MYPRTRTRARTERTAHGSPGVTGARCSTASATRRRPGLRPAARSSWCTPRSATSGSRSSGSPRAASTRRWWSAGAARSGRSCAGAPSGSSATGCSGPGSGRRSSWSFAGGCPPGRTSLPRVRILDEQVERYLDGLRPKRSGPMAEMEELAEREVIPIVHWEAGRFLATLCRALDPVVLEVGTAIGYSTLHMAEQLSNGRVITLEVDPARAAQARDFLGRAGVAERVELVEGD